MPTFTSTLHLISGLPASGKSTYAQKLTQQTKGVVLSLDYWLQTAFGHYVIDEVGHAEHIRRVLACRKLIKDVAQEFLARDTDVILDDGFFLKADRIEYHQWAQKIGSKSVTHYLETEMPTLMTRIEMRNAQLPEYNFTITPQILQEMKAMFEIPDKSEGELVVIPSANGSN